MCNVGIVEVLHHIETHHSHSKFTCKKLAEELGITTEVLSRRLVKLRFQNIIKGYGEARANRPYKLVDENKRYNPQNNKWKVKQ